REELSEIEAVRDRPARSAILLNRCIARAHSTADAREALAGLGYDVLDTAVPRLGGYAQSFGMPIRSTRVEVWGPLARGLIERCSPLCAERIGPRRESNARHRWPPPRRGAPSPARPRPAGPPSGPNQCGSPLT